MLDLIFKQLLPYLRPYKKKIVGIFSLSVILACIGGAQIRLVKPIFDKGLSPETPQQDIIFLAAALLGLGLINFPTRFFHFYGIRFVMERAIFEVRTEIFKKFQRIPTAFFGKSKQGNLISNIINDTQVFSEGFKGAIDLVRESLKASVYLAMAFWSDWQLTIVIFIMAPFLIAIFNVSGKKVKNNQGNVQESFGELTHTIAEGISGHKITKAFNLQSFVNKRFRGAQEGYFGARMKTSLVEELAHPFVEVIGACAFSGVIVFAHHRIASGATTVGGFISFIAALALFMDPVRKFSQANVKLSQAKAAAERIFHVLNMEEESSSGTIKIDKLEKGITVENVTFSYGEGNVIENLSLEIKKGQKVALVGLSGSGKSTLINLLLGLYPIDKGDIKIDGHSIKDIKLSSLRNLFGLVSQDIFLFHDSIKENLLVGNDFSDEEITESLKVAYAKDFIDKLPNGIDTVIGDKGSRLSGGQQQRVTIARAFLQNTDVLLFDEATSALDNESEKVVQKALEHIAGSKTVIAVAHRLSTIQDYDQIYVMHEGHLVEQGSHEQLMSKDGEYSKLYSLSQKV